MRQFRPLNAMAIAAIVALTLVAAYVFVSLTIAHYDDGGFAGTWGWPFAWRRWTDDPVPGAQDHGISWWGLVSDAAICIAAALAFGWPLESARMRWIAHRADSGG